jgi:hypothetical protein
MRHQLWGRTKLTFAYIYWTNANIRDMTYDAATGRAYSTAFSSTPRVPALVNVYSADNFCTDHGMSVTEVTSIAEAGEQMRTNRFGDQFIGAKRMGTTQDFAWDSNASLAMTFQLWRPLEPTTVASENCAKLTAQQTWRDEACSSYIPSIGCEVASWTLAGSYVHTYVSPAQQAQEFGPSSYSTCRCRTLRTRMPRGSRTVPSSTV